MGILRRLFCLHAHDRRERDAKGRLVLVCDSCGRSVLALDRTDRERRLMKKRYPAPQVRVAKPAESKVTPLRRKQG